MNDKNIQELVKMAMEIEALERAGESGGVLDSTEPIAVIGQGRILEGHGAMPAGNWGRRILVGVGLGTAAAACLTVALIALRPSARWRGITSGCSATTRRGGRWLKPTR